MIAPKLSPREKAFPPRRKTPYSEYPRKNKMTIAAAFCCSDGVVLCADSQYTYPETLKYQESKLRMGPDLKCHPFFAFCGDMDYQKQCIANFRAALSRAEREQVDVTIALETAALKMHTTYYEAYSDPSEKLSASMFASVLTDQGRLVFKIVGPKVTQVEELEFMGSGGYLARALADSFWEPFRFMYRTVFACTFILSDVKEYVDGCGGDSHIACLGHDGSETFFSEIDSSLGWPIKGIEKHYQTWKQRLGALLMDSQDCLVTQDSFQAKVTKLCNSLVKERAGKAEIFEHMKKKLDDLARPVEEEGKG